MEVEQRDLEILQILRENGRLSNLCISRMTGIPVTSVRQRIKRMEKEELITQYVARLNYDKLGWSTIAYVHITLDFKKLREKGLTHDEFVEKFAEEFPFISNVTSVSGDADVVLRLRARSLSDLNKQVNKISAKFDEIERTKTMIGLHDVRKKVKTDFKMWKALHN